MTTEQSNQTIHGHQVNVGGDLKADHIGDRIQTEGGDYVKGDKHVHIYPEQADPPKPHLPYEPETVVVPAGPFLMGDNADPLTAPQHNVDLPAFGIGRFPVTNRKQGAWP